MKQILSWLIVLALVAVTLSASAELPLKKDGVPGDLKTASTFIGGPLGYGWGWSYPYWGYGWGGWGWGYPGYWG